MPVLGFLYIYFFLFLFYLFVTLILGMLLIRLCIRKGVFQGFFGIGVRWVLRPFSLQFLLKRRELDTLLPCCKTFHGVSAVQNPLQGVPIESDNAPCRSECISLTQELPALAIWLRLFWLSLFFFSHLPLLRKEILFRVFLKYFKKHGNCLKAKYKKNAFYFYSFSHFFCQPRAPSIGRVCESSLIL